MLHVAYTENRFPVYEIRSMHANHYTTETVVTADRLLLFHCSGLRGSYILGRGGGLPILPDSPRKQITLANKLPGVSVSQHCLERYVDSNKSTKTNDHLQGVIYLGRNCRDTYFSNVCQEADHLSVTNREGFCFVESFGGIARHPPTSPNVKRLLDVVEAAR